MADKGFLSMSRFMKVTRVTRNTLRYYDEIGLLSPVQRGENNYRYYSGIQLPAVKLVRTLQSLGMTLEEIKKLRESNNSTNIDEIFEQQINKIDIKINDLISSRKLLFALIANMRSVTGIDETAISTVFLPAAPIVLGELNDYSDGGNEYDALIDFYQDCNEKYPAINLNYPVWGFFSKERLKRRDFIWPDRYYFYHNDGKDVRPAALYAIGYTRGGYGQCGELYERLLDYISKNALVICGDAYEEYPLNELCINDNTKYLIRIMIPVRDKKIAASAAQTQPK